MNENYEKLYASNRKEIESENNIQVENRLYNISDLIPNGNEKDALHFLNELNYLIKTALGYKYTSLVVSKEEVDYNYYDTFLTGKRMETDEEKELRLNNLKLRQDYLNAVNEEIQSQTMKPVNVLELPTASPRPNENTVFWFNDRGIGLFKVKFPNPTKYREFCTKLERIREVFHPNVSIYSIHELLDEELRTKKREEALKASLEAMAKNVND